ncbi:hypothetical protein INT08_10115 [Prosthecochloris sp. N3]|uniref:Uncharacterized protein n=1 Tax=Prosthecochloris ethylica TaxID=2743976 RepID=A0ABR9XUG4_9CHLB|nr:MULTISPECIES: hypothetical protein [Prosthecochloris]MEC9486190.1 hypothetical protein [Prosthecochloris sp.]MBF0586581.1 hypothetical protein [Prosthecochloris ethylica]MBF0637522.1 hypothetical protein [Prosthecochloris ethylica]NUK47671.1 hypothetical protein [Prosthecochloris ethylica]RNA64340.1 hypothetical protein CR163_003215 [Prosthecochloris sp. ZM_2]
MDQIISLLVSNPLYLVAAVMVAVVILLVTLKKVIRLALLLASLFVLYIAYLYWTGADVTGSVQGVEDFVLDMWQKITLYLKSLGS